MFEDKIKSLQKIIDRCIKHDNHAHGEALYIKCKYLTHVQRPEYIRKEIFKVTEELVNMYQRFPAIQAFERDWDIPDFVWESAFIENLTKEERRKFMDFPYQDFDYKRYFENPTSYDEQLPYLSSTIKWVVYHNYLKLLQQEEQRLFQPPDTQQTAVEVKVSTPSKKVEGIDNPFKCKLDKEAIRLLTDCVNDAHIFTTEITPGILADFFYCRLTGALKSNNNRLLAYFMMKLSIYEYITHEWQSVIAKNKLILASKKEKYLNNSDLSTANDSIKYILPKKSEIIDKYIKELKKH
jgi:hypothetical protein